MDETIIIDVSSIEVAVQKIAVESKTKSIEEQLIVVF